MQNPAYVRGSEENFGMPQREYENENHRSPPVRPTAPPGNRKSVSPDVADPNANKNKSLESAALFTPRRRSYERLDRVESIEPNNKDHRNNVTSGNKQDGGRVTQNSHRLDMRRESAASQTSQKSRASVIEHVDESDDFPWNPKPTQNVRFSPDVDATSVSIYDAQSRRASAISKEEEKKQARFLWWKRFVKKLEDNKILTPEAMRHLIKQEKAQDRHFRMVKKVMNVVFLMAGIILLLAVIVLIINTDPFFDESMRALTVFLAGRGRGIW